MRRVIVVLTTLLVLVSAGGIAPASHPEDSCSAEAVVAIAPEGPSCSMTLACPGTDACLYEIQASFEGIGYTRGTVTGGGEDLTGCDSPPLLSCTVFALFELPAGTPVFPVVCLVTGGDIPVVLTPAVSCEAFALGHIE